MNVGRTKRFGTCKVEVNHGDGTSRLRLSGQPLWCTSMTGADYVASKDTRPY